MKKIVPAPYIDQTERWVNGCESISSVMLLQAVGIDIDPDTFIARDLPHAPYWEQDGKLYGPDPWQVYPGDPHDHTGYGCYAPCIVKALNSALEHEGAADQFEVVDESGKTAAELCRLHRRRDAGGVLGDAGLSARAGEAGPLAAGRRHRLCMEVQRALPAAGGLR